MTLQEMYSFLGIILQIGHFESLLEYSRTVQYALLWKDYEMRQILPHTEIPAFY
jgi:hypothetical protein